MREWLCEARKNKNFTMAEVAAKSNISESYYSMIERGSRNVPVHTAKKIAKVLDFNWTKFYEDDPEAFKQGIIKKTKKEVLNK